MFRSMLKAAVLAAALGVIPASASAAAPAPVAAAGEEQGIVGTWRLVAFEDHYKDGRVDKPFGEQPRGYFTYDPTGHLSIHIMKTPPLAPFASGDVDAATDAEKAKAFDAYVGYFGTYRVDKKNGVLHHQVEGALNTTYTDTDQLRPYRLNGDVLVIEIKNDEGRFYRELHRVR